MQEVSSWVLNSSCNYACEFKSLSNSLIFLQESPRRHLLALTPRLQHFDASHHETFVSKFPSLLYVLKPQQGNRVLASEPSCLKRVKQTATPSFAEDTQHRGPQWTTKESKVGAKLDTKLQCLKFSMPSHPTSSLRNSKPPSCPFIYSNKKSYFACWK